jgi:5-methylcytosine-specific restriction endonuclease McrA
MNQMLADRHCAGAIPEEYRDRTPTREKVFVQFLADEDFLQLFEEIRDLKAGSAFDSFVDVIKPVLKEYRDRHSPAARRERREARKAETNTTEAKKREESPDSHRWEWENAQSAARVMVEDHPRERSQARDESRHLPDETRDEVFVRDGGQCTFVATDGTRCQCKKGVQVDHIRPFANGGTHDPSNLRLLCGAHNRRAAERTMGAHVMKQFWRTQ